MILPTKHIKITESIFGLGGYILKFIQSDPQTIDSLWHKVKTLNKNQKFNAYHGFDSLVLSLNYLYIIGAIEIDQEDKIYNAIISTSSK